MRSALPTFFLSLLSLVFGGQDLRAQTAETTSTSECGAGDQIESVICEDAGLQAAKASMERVLEAWKTGINKNRIDYLLGEQAEWEGTRAECLSAQSPSGCLRGKYEERTQLLTQPRIFQTDITIDGNAYRQLAEMTPLSFRALQIEKRLDAFGFLNSEIEAMKSQLSQVSGDVCSTCSHERVRRLRLGFQNSALLVVNQSELETIDNGDEIYRYQSYFFDKNSGQNIGFNGLFDPNSVPFAQQAVIDEIMENLSALNTSVSGNAAGDTIYYWGSIETTLKNQGASGWNEMGFFPLSQSGVLSGFRYKSDAYEFAPYGSSSYFSDFTIDSAAFHAFLKPAYRGSFQ